MCGIPTKQCLMKTQVPAASNHSLGTESKHINLYGEYLLGSKFTIYTDNNSLAYVKESKWVVAQIRWLSKLALFDFDMKYRSGKSNQAADTLSHCPMTDDEILSDTESDVYETISYTALCNGLKWSN